MGIKTLNVSFARLQELEAVARQNISAIRDWLLEAVNACNKGSGDRASCQAIASARQQLALAVDFADVRLDVIPQVKSRILSLIPCFNFSYRYREALWN